MKDRQSGTGGFNTVNGAKRYGVYDTATATTATEYKFLLLEDYPVETGTALSKANLLTDATAEKFSLGATGTINDALTKIGDYTDIAMSATWTPGTLSGVSVYYKDLTATDVTTSSKPLLHAVTPAASALSKADVKAARKQAAKIIGYDVITNGTIRVYAYENITVALVARFTNI